MHGQQNIKKVFSLLTNDANIEDNAAPSKRREILAQGHRVPPLRTRVFSNTAFKTSDVA